ncbi:uncharacterized protein LOC128117164 [Peromyscus californicus insignis]|uniref:uncharacterized protein LOC128117164 n=1 Tax=Peromyscus californicus insignis TaxID=564181 RepID=UPI0022A6A685|nr:uncharacterized protein LOC128117164 [Peromyscus californicus insignis]
MAPVGLWMLQGGPGRGRRAQCAVSLRPFPTPSRRAAPAASCAAAPARLVQRRGGGTRLCHRTRAQSGGGESTVRGAAEDGARAGADGDAGEPGDLGRAPGQACFKAGSSSRKKGGVEETVSDLWRLVRPRGSGGSRPALRLVVLQERKKTSRRLSQISGGWPALRLVVLQVRKKTSRRLSQVSQVGETQGQWRIQACFKAGSSSRKKGGVEETVSDLWRLVRPRGSGGSRPALRLVVLQERKKTSRRLSQISQVGENQGQCRIQACFKAGSSARKKEDIEETVSDLWRLVRPRGSGGSRPALRLVVLQVRKKTSRRRSQVSQVGETQGQCRIQVLRRQVQTAVTQEGLPALLCWS